MCHVSWTGCLSAVVSLPLSSSHWADRGGGAERGSGHRGVKPAGGAQRGQPGDGSEVAGGAESV